MRKLILILGLLALFAVEIFRVYFIMPFPGSQKADTIGFAYWLGQNITWLRLLIFAILLYPLLYSFRKNSRWRNIGLVTVLLLYGVVFYFVNFRFLADKMFLQPVTKNFVAFRNSQEDSSKLVIGVTVNGQSKAYPVELIGYHHQVRDSIGGQAVMVTYCTVCRTGRVYSPLVDGIPDEFRLVGMDHFNAMFEDSRTRSWWQQATGEAVTGQLKGKRLPEIPSRQMSLAAWARLNPGTTVLQPDPAFTKKYASLKGYDEGTIEGGLEHRDSSSWADKSWVIGVEYATRRTKAYDWNELVKRRILFDSSVTAPVMLVLENDGRSFHVFKPVVDGNTIAFDLDPATGELVQPETGDRWTIDGRAISGTHAGQQLATMPAYQEFWHSWKQFHPNTRR